MEYLKIYLKAHDRIKVRGYEKSMEPLIKESDMLLLTKVEEIELGDILLYYVRNRYVVHRVIALSQNLLSLRGIILLLQRLYRDAACLVRL